MEQTLMKKEKEIIPPRWATRLLRWYCRPALLEDLQGDLLEYFHRNSREKGVPRAKLIYVLDVLKFFRPYTVSKPEFLSFLINWIMLGSYIRTSGRNLVRNKLFSIINIAGLSISMTVGLLLIVIISDFFSYDDFHKNKDHIYRLTTTDVQTGQRTMTFASTSVKAGKEIEEYIPGIEELALLRDGFGGDAKVGDNVLPLHGLWASESFFDVFTFPLIEGNPSLALKEPYSLVLTEKSAVKLFGTKDAIGKSVRFDTTNYVVTGVMRDIPKLSHLRFEVLASFATAEIQIPKEDPNFLSWISIYSNYVYLLLPPDGDPETLQASLDQLSKNENAGLSNREITLSLTPLTEIAVGKRQSNQIGPTMEPLVIWILVGLASIVILSACFNYTNLSIARSLRRSREVGIRKVIGALKSNVRTQFMVESMVIALLALVVSFGLFLFLRRQFLSLNPHLEELVSLKVSPPIVLYFVTFALAVGLIAGFLPALFFSRINPMHVLKDMTSMKVFRRVTMRKALIVIQYTFSLIFITTTIIGYDQYKGFLNFDLGFTTENVLNIDLQGNKGDLLAQKLEALPEISDISRSDFVTSLGSFRGTTVKYKNSTDSAMVGLNLVDGRYIPLHHHQLIAGTNFTARPKREEDESEVIVNEQVLKRFDIAPPDDPAKAIGEQLTIDQKKLTIVGVLKDFHYGTVEDKIGPVMLRYSTGEKGGYLNIKVVSSDVSSTLTSIENAWKAIDPIHPLVARFYDDQIQEAYSQFSVMIKVIGFLAFLAVVIATIGMFGMVVYTTETKLKEISIRKVLGATEAGLIYLLSRGFLFLLVSAAAIALPLTYIIFDKIILVNFAYHQPIGFLKIAAGILAVLAIAFAMIGSQTMKVARANPAEVLKNE
jgi:putative ABC transport system permease protein